MADLMKVVKEANAEIIEIIKSQKQFDDEQLLQNIKDIGAIIDKHYERVKDQCSQAMFSELLGADIRFNFIGGAIVNTEGSTEIKIE